MKKTVFSNEPSLHLRLLGTATVTRDGAVVPLPASRKVRALLAYLALAPQAVPRSQLCDLLWDGPDDPRGQLRWCLSKIRSVIDQPAALRNCSRIESHEDTVRLVLAAGELDAAEIAAAIQAGLETLPTEQLRRLTGLFAGDVLHGLEADSSPEFNSWLMAQRRRFRGYRVALLEHLVKRLPDDEALLHLEQWRQLAPFDRRAHEALLLVLARQGRIREGDEHVAATARLFEAEEMDDRPIRAMWQAARVQTQAQQAMPPAQESVIAATPDVAAAETPAGTLVEPLTGPARRASIAVMPFLDRNTAVMLPGGLADGLTTDVIIRLAKLRNMLVISQGTTFALRDRWVGPEEAGRMLNVDYVVSGSLRRQDGRVIVSVELAETRTARVIWADSFDRKTDNEMQAFDEVGDRIVDSLAHEVETTERNRAILKAPNSLNAWEAYHRGMWHYYRFERSDNETAQHFFQTALKLDPTFSRAYAGLASTHYQNAFQGWADRASEGERAYAAAGQGLMADDRDPACHEIMGRALWLRGLPDQALTELEHSIDISPNFVQGHYALAYFHCLAGDPQAAIAAADHSRRISPYDPLLFAMLASRAFGLLRLKRFDEAADYAVRAAARPNAHVHVQALAAYALALADRVPEARLAIARVRAAVPDYGIEPFLSSMELIPESAQIIRAVAPLLDA